MKQRIILLVILLSTLINSFAQQDSLQTYRDFIFVCNNYQQLPLHLKLAVYATTNFITGENDTAHLEAEFFIKPHCAYLKMGEMEQISTDSLGLMVSNQARRMIVYPFPVRQTASDIFRNFSISNRSLLELGKRYGIEKQMHGKDTAVITLLSKATVSGTTDHLESIELMYDPQRQVPLQVVAIKRSLIPLDEQEYRLVVDKKEFSGKLLTVGDQQHYIVKEQSTSFSYINIEHNQGMEVPITLADRIERTKSGDYVPVPTYATYLVTKNQ